MRQTSRRIAAALAAASVCLGAAGTAQAASQSTSSSQALAAKLGHLMREAGHSVSGLVVDQSTGKTLFAENANSLRLPASVEKLYTTATALLEFGPDYRFQTDVYGVGATVDGTFTGTLYLKGGGDPSFGDAHFDAVNYGTGATVQALARTLASGGLRKVAGNIVADSSIFDGLGGGPDTGYRASSETEGELSGLSYDAGWTSSSQRALQPNPGIWAAKSFVSVARSAGIGVQGGIKITSGTVPAGATVLGRVYSPTVATLVKLTNVPSDNFFAETLLKDEGYFFGAGGSTAAGAAEVDNALGTRLGVTPRTDDGSGLSRHDRSTATQIVEMLEEMSGDSAFVNSLAVAGRSGTMKDEMRGTPGAGNCRGKTGTLHDVANLVGYCTAANGHKLVFAFLENGLHNAGYGHALEDVMGEALAEYRGSGSGVPAPALPVPNPSYAPAAGYSTGGTPPSGSGSGSGTGSGSGSGAGSTTTTTATAPAATTPAATPPGGGSGAAGL